MALCCSIPKTVAVVPILLSNTVCLNICQFLFSSGLSSADVDAVAVYVCIPPVGSDRHAPRRPQRPTRTRSHVPHPLPPISSTAAGYISPRNRPPDPLRRRLRCGRSPAVRSRSSGQQHTGIRIGKRSQIRSRLPPPARGFSL
jgi:hypothetical protein